MGTSSGSILSEDQQSLYNVAKGAMPPEFWQNGQDSEELPGAFAVEASVAKASIDADYHRTMILDSSGTWLDQHAIDRGTRRQASETDSSLQTRLRSLSPAVTMAVITGSVNSFISGSGQSGSIGYIELRKSKGFMSQLPDLFVSVSASLITTGSWVQIGLPGGTQDTFVFGTTGSSPPGTFYVDISSASFPELVASSFASAVASASSAGTTSGLTYRSYWDPRLQNTARVFNQNANRRLSGSIMSGATFSLATGSHGAYVSRGYRMGSLPPLNELIIVLPTGTLDSVRSSATELVRKLKAAGTRITIEQRGLHQ